MRAECGQNYGTGTQGSWFDAQLASFSSLNQRHRMTPSKRRGQDPVGPFLHKNGWKWVIVRSLERVRYLSYQLIALSITLGATAITGVLGDRNPNLSEQSRTMSRQQLRAFG